MNIVGHQKILNFLNKSLEKGSLSHAYIFSGPEHLGKFGVALDFAQKLSKSEAKINPDIIILEPEIVENSRGIMKEAEIKIEEIREFQKKLGTTAYFGRYKVGIIDNADKMNKSSQNAMLKILEEPSEKIIIILVVRDINKIIPTIKSRCAIKKFGLVSHEDMEKIIPSETKDRDEIIFWSLGRPGLAKKIMENGKELENMKDAQKELTSLFGSNVCDKFSLAEKMSKDIQAAIKKLEWWTVLLRENLLGDRIVFSRSSSKIIYLVDRIEENIGLLRDTNSNARLVLENLFLEM